MILGAKQFPPGQARWDGPEFAVVAEQLRLQSLNSHLGSIQAFAGLAETAQRLGLQDSAERARANTARQYRRVVMLLSKHPFSQKLQEGFESRLSLLRSTLRLSLDVPYQNGAHTDRTAAPAPPVACALENAPSADASPEELNIEGPSADRLTSRETQILKLIAEGNSSRQVALRLGISFRTATCHRYNIMSKLNLHDTSALVRYAIRSGLVRL